MKMELLYNTKFKQLSYQLYRWYEDKSNDCTCYSCSPELLIADEPGQQHWMLLSSANIRLIKRIA